MEASLELLLKRKDIEFENPDHNESICERILEVLVDSGKLKTKAKDQVLGRMIYKNKDSELDAIKETIKSLLQIEETKLSQSRIKTENSIIMPGSPSQKNPIEL